ncbi:COR domain-containing protein [Candidatus Electronema sp. PJ]|uniref:COR domain-containing protein n=1 Tax=Candidatus Electronema sp. PJ TaxID=3401572 RepID=UPI003AA9AD6E
MTNEELLKKIEKAKASGAIMLDLRSNRLTTLPPELFQLTSLTKLYLSNNQLAALPPELFQMKNLTGLDLGGLKLTTLPPEICQLTNLTTLDLRGNQLTALPPELFHLTKLTELSLSGNQITTLPQEIGQLTRLTELSLSGNQLTALPTEICHLTNLTGLYLSGNQLTALPTEICHLKRLTMLFLGDNQITTLPQEIGQLTRLTGLALNDNPLVSPPLEIARQGLWAIREYFASLKPEDHPLNQVKILLVGDGAAGKTSLVKQLLGEEFDKDEDTTHGINIRGWDVEANQQKIRVNLWDFGGQEVMHATHQFFLSKRSLYLLVLDTRKDERAEYWLRHIESFGGDSPVLIVLNKYDTNPSFDLNRHFLLGKYPVIKGFHRTSCATGQGIDRFREALLDALAKVEMIGIRWPKSWFAVKQQLEQMPKPYISCDEYGTFCAEAGIAEDQAREVLVDFLHDLGIAVHFKDFELKHTHVLDPKWVTAAVYKIINAELVAARGGILHINSLTEILRKQDKEKYDFPAEMHRYILDLMKQFELCYDLDSQRVLIPQLLPVQEPEFTYDDSHALRFAFLYEDFLPTSILPRFIVKRHKEIKASLCWRTGVVLQDKDSGSVAMVKADYEKRRIDIWVNGSRRKEYLHFLWYSLREINASFEKLRFRERVPMPDDPERTADYETLLKHAKRGNDIYYAEGSDKEYSVKELLGLVQPKDSDELQKSIEKIHPQSAEKESIVDIITSVIDVKIFPPSIDLNLNNLFKRLRDWEKQKRKQSAT